ncbi:hypothetical protein AHAS_Ahas12G0200100 [Arachis hypogaea]
MAYSSSSSLIISPRKLRYDLYSYSYQEDSNTPLVINVLASLIERSMARTQRIVKNYSSSSSSYASPPSASTFILSSKSKNTNIFDCREIPDMTIQSYLERIFRNYRNSYFARVGGLTTNELNKLEVEFLFLMGFKLHVNVSVFESYCCHLEREVSIGGGYHIERTLRCAEQIKASQHTDDERGYTQIARVML